MDADILRDFLGGVDRFDPNLFSKLGADAQSSLANLANNIGMTAEEPNALFLAKAQFAEANGDFRGAGKLLDTDRHASADGAELKELRRRRIARFPTMFDLVAHAQTKLGQLRLSCKRDLRMAG